MWPYHDHGPNHTLNTFRGLFGAIIVRPKGAKWPDRSYMRVRAPAAAADHRPPAELPVLQRPRVRRQHADAALERRRGRRDQRVRHGLELPHLPHPRPPLEGSGGGLCRQPLDGAERDRSRPALSRTTRVAGSTTVTSSPIRTRGWRAGTWWIPNEGGRHSHFPAHRAARRAGGRAARAHRRERADYPGPRTPARSSPSPRARTTRTRSATRRAAVTSARSRRRSTRPAPATRSACATASTARP